MSLTVLVNDTSHSFTTNLFFYSPKYIQSNHSLPIVHFLLLNKNKPVVRIYFTIEGNKAHSMQHTSFGGFEFNGEVTNNDLSFLISEIETYFKTNNIKQISITLAPNCYTSLKPLPQSTELIRNNFSETKKEINYHLNIDSNIGYRKNLDSSEKNKLNKSQKAGFHTKKLSIESFNSCFDLIVKNRELKGFPITITKEKMLKLASTFNEIHLFGTYDTDELIATSISIQVTPTILYNFYMADDYNYRSYSPLVMLNNFVYDWCLQNNISTLDLGTVSKNGIINTGLADFKKHLGGIRSDKLTFSKNSIIA